MTGELAPTRSLGRTMAMGSLWMIAGRWTVRGIGLISTIILARLLTPADFGLIAMAMLVIGALQVMTDAGQRQAIIRMPELEREHYDTAWTLSVLIGATVALGLALAAPIAAEQFAEPRVRQIMWLLALRPLIMGFENIGLVDFQRQLDFRKDLLVMLLGKLGSFLITIVLALILRDWRALVSGTLAGAVIAVVLSYAFSRYRPWFCLRRIGEIWSFSAWALLNSIALYASERTDQAVVAGVLDPSSVGAYTVGGELAALPTEELVIPPVRVLFAVYSRLTHDPAALREHYLSALSFIVIAASSTGAGMALIAEDAVQLLLGRQWLAAIDIVPWFAAAAGLMGVAGSVNSVLMAAGYARANAVRAIAFATLLLPCALAGVTWRGAEGVAIARFAATLLFTPVMLYLAMRLLLIPLRSLLACLWRPAMATLLMAAAVLLLRPHLPDFPALRLALAVAAGAATYTAALAALWWSTGRPAGAEAALWQMVCRG